MKYLSCLSVLLLLIAACTSTEEPKPGANEDESCACAEPEPEVEPEPEPEPEETRGELEDEGAPEQAKAVKMIEEVTGLKFRHNVPVYLYTPGELEEEVKTWGDGFVPDNILGFYKWSTKALYLVPEAAGNKRAFGLRIHEACHALQDQLWGLKKLHGMADSTDEDQAMLGLIEGHAVQVMIDALIEEQPHVAYIAMAKAPEGSTKPREYRAVYTYAQGTRFIQHLKELGGYERVHQAFEKPPVSSEQILHPEKYTDEVDTPDSIEFDLAAIKNSLPLDWSLLKPDTLGEFETRLVFVQQEETVFEAAEIAAGWGGDRRVQAFKEDKKLTLWVTSWDTEEDAAEYRDALDELPDLRAVHWDENDPLKVFVLLSEIPLPKKDEDALMDALRNTQIVINPR